jgi:hypothetical protein
MPIHVLSDIIGFHILGSGNGRETHPLQEDQHQPSQAQHPESFKLRAYQHVIRKLEYYIAHVAATPIGILEGVSGEVVRWSQKVKIEGQGSVRISSAVEREL